MKVTCNNCKEEVEVIMYFYDSKIITSDSLNLFNTKEYEAVVHGKAICPFCGSEIREIFHTKITKKDILWLATGEKK